MSEFLHSSPPWEELPPEWLTSEFLLADAICFFAGIATGYKAAQISESCLLKGTMMVAAPAVGVVFATLSITTQDYVYAGIMGFYLTGYYCGYLYGRKFH